MIAYIYNKVRQVKHILLTSSFLLITCSFASSCVDNDFEDDSKGTFYTSTKITAAEFINANLDRLSEFKAVLEKANYFTFLHTYGTFTVFIPTNEAVDTYLHSKGYQSVEETPVDVCDTIARSHIINGKEAFFTSDLTDGGGKIDQNMDDHFVELSFGRDTTDNSVIYYVNKSSKIIERDDSVTNGVCHIIDKALASSSVFLPSYIQQDTCVSIFSQALQATGLYKKMEKYLDETYSCSADSVSGNITPVYYGGHNHSQNDDNSLRYPDKRYFKYTLFMETDAVMHANGIDSLPQLKSWAKDQYDKTYPEDKGKYDDDYTNPKNPLNRFVAYHMVDRAGTYSDWAPSGQIYSNCWKPEVADAEDYFPSMCQGQILRFCRLSNGRLYINRRGRGNTVRPGCDGIRVYTNEEAATINPNPNVSPTGSINGVYFYLDNMLWFSPTTRDDVLNVRMRIDATTLSPDFMNQDARGHYGQEILCMFKNDYVENFKLSDETKIGVHNDNMWWSSYLGNAVCIKGRFDLSFKLPPVPKAGTYEIRLGYVSRTNGSTMQVYLTDENGNENPCGIPFNQTIGSWDSRVGFEDDKTPEGSGLSESECLQYNKGIDKTMRNHGYMKAMDSYRKGTGATSFRVDAPESLRRILISNTYLDPQVEYWMRFRKSDNENDDTEFSFDYIEIVPSDVYNNPNGEDQH